MIAAEGDRKEENVKAADTMLFASKLCNLKNNEYWLNVRFIAEILAYTTDENVFSYIQW